MDSVNGENPYSNIENSERLLSLTTAVLFTLGAMSRLFSNPVIAVAQLGLTSLLLDRGISGHCIIKEATKRINRIRQPKPYKRGFPAG